MSYVCTIEVPPKVCDQLGATITVDLLEEPAYLPTDIINKDQDYIVRVDVELGSPIKKLICGEWAVSVTAEGLGPAKEFKKSLVIPMNNCDPKPDRAEIRIKGTEFEASPDGDVYYLVATVVARDNCDHKTVGLVGFCKIGPVMVYG